FVRRADETQSWLASGTLAPEKTAADWLGRDLADIDAARIAEVVLTDPQGKVVRVAKAAQGDANFTLADVPKGREPASDYAVNNLASGLDGLRFDDVAPASEAAAPEDARKARYATFEGLVVDMVAWEADGKHFARFAASLDPVRVAARSVPEKADDGEGDSGAEKAEEGKPAEAAAPVAADTAGEGEKEARSEERSWRERVGVCGPG